MTGHAIPAGYTQEHREGFTVIYLSTMPHLRDIVGAPGPLGAPSRLSGRTTLRIVEPDMVVRPLVHGGLFRHITGGRFLGVGRTMQEIRVSDFLATNGIPTPEILAVRMARAGLFYHIEVVSRLVPDAVDLLTYLEVTRDDSREFMRKAGTLIRRMHDVGVYHNDLHIKNLLLDGYGELWVLDLDKAWLFERLPGFMRRLNVNRFLRSVRKWHGRGRIVLPGAWELSFRAGYEEEAP